MAPIRICLLAVAAVAAVVLCGHAGPAGHSPLLWLSGAVLVAVRPPRRWRGAWAMAVVFGLAGSLAALEATRRAVPVPPAGATADDRSADTIEGIAVGPMDGRGGRLRFVVEAADGGTPILVSALGVVPVLPGDRVRVTGRLRTPRGYRVPGGVDMRALLEARGARWSLACDAADVVVVDRGASASAWRPAVAAQRWLSGAIGERGGDAAGNAVVRAMVAGDRGGLDDETTDVFREAGVSHVLAVSGLHLAIVALFVFAAVRRLWAACPPLCMRVGADRVAALVAAPAAVAYTVITGGRISTVRALVVVLAVLAGAAMRRRLRVLDAVGAAALGLIAARPSVVWDPSFQLSFAAAATLSMVIVRGRGWIASSVAVSVWAAAATAPFAALAFHSVALAGPVANLIVVPITELVVLPFALAGAAITPVWEGGGGALIDVAVLAASVAIDVAGWIGGAVPSVRVWPPNAFELVCAAVAWVAAVGAARRWWRVRSAAVACAIATVAVIGSYAFTGPVARATRADLSITFLDVGQGDAAIVEVPGGQIWLIDSGGLPFVPDAEVLGPRRARRIAEGPGEHSVARFLAARRIARLDVVVISHPHPDHFMGLRAVARAVDIAEVWVARPDPDQPLGGELAVLLAELEATGTRVSTPPIGVARHAAGVELEVLGPRYDGHEAAVDPVMTVNDNSLVVRVTRGDRRVLFAGDIEVEGEERLVADLGPALRADVVKVPHHGSRTSSSEAFVSACAPELAVISLGVANRFEFPAPEVVARWRDAGARVARTDRRGAVTVVISADGELSVSTFD